MAAGGVVVSPSILRVDLAKDDSEALVSYRNETSNEVTLVFTARTIKPEIYPNLEFNSEDSLAEIASWVSYDRDRVTLLPQEIGVIKLNFAKELSPGGHYAALIAELSDNQMIGLGSEKSQVMLQGMLVTPVFVRAKEGTRIEQIVVSEIETPGVLWLYPEEIILLITNKGNVESAPFSKLKIQSNSGEVVSEGVINENSTLLLPSATRRYVSQISTKSDFILPGKYEILGKIQSGEEQVEIRHTFVTMGSWHMHTLLALILGLSLLVWMILKSPTLRMKLRYVRLK